MDHIPVLDGMRGVAILLVLFTHLAGPEVAPALRDGSTWDRLYARVASLGDSGVDFFFALSGFLITRILLRARRAPGALRNFYVRRVLRIFPLYYACLFGVFLIMPMLLPITPAVSEVQHHQVWLWLYGANIATGILNIWFSGDWLLLTHFWSLAVEEQFYFFWPLLVLWLSPRKLMGTCLALAACAFVVKLAFLHAHLGHAAYLLTPCRLDALSLGGAVAVALCTPAVSADARRLLLPLARMGLVASAVLLGLQFSSQRNAPRHWWTPATVHTFFATFFVALLLLGLLSDRRSLSTRLWTLPVLRFFGKYSYGLYVIHYVLRPLYMQWIPPASLARALGGSHVLSALTFGVVTTALSVGAAWMSWHGLEKHFLRLKSLFEYRNPNHVASPAPSVLPGGTL